MQARDDMTLRIILVKADASLMDAVRLMLRNRIGGDPRHSDHGVSGRQRPGARKRRRRDPLSCQAMRSRRVGGVRSPIEPDAKEDSHE
jgi:CBS domain-containing protein